MNLYRINFRHYSQKDSSEGIDTYLLAKDDADVYDWFNKEKYTYWADQDEEGEMLDIYNDEYDVIGQETFRERMLRVKGDMNDEDHEPQDLYYGAIAYGWEQVSSDSLALKVDALRLLGILKEIKND